MTAVRPGSPCRVPAPPTDSAETRSCHRCGDEAAGQVSSGYPDHIWRWWCRTCLVANRRAYQEARR